MLQLTEKIFILILIRAIQSIHKQLMKNKPKIVKFRRQDYLNDQSTRYVGFVQRQRQDLNQIKRNNQTKIDKKYSQNQPDQRQNKATIVAPQNQNRILNKNQLNKMSFKRLNSDLDFTDNEDILVSSIKKNFEKVKISMPKDFRPDQEILSLKNGLLQKLRKNQSDLNIQQIFSLSMTQQILGKDNQNQRKLILKPKTQSHNEDQTQRQRQKQTLQLIKDKLPGKNTNKLVFQDQQRKKLQDDQFESPLKILKKQIKEKERQQRTNYNNKDTPYYEVHDYYQNQQNQSYNMDNTNFNIQYGIQQLSSSDQDQKLIEDQQYTYQQQFQRYHLNQYHKNKKYERQYEPITTTNLQYSQNHFNPQLNYQPQYQEVPPQFYQHTNIRQNQRNKPSMINNNRFMIKNNLESLNQNYQFFTQAQRDYFQQHFYNQPSIYYQQNIVGGSKVPSKPSKSLINQDSYVQYKYKQVYNDKNQYYANQMIDQNHMMPYYQENQRNMQSQNHSNNSMINKISFSYENYKNPIHQQIEQENSQRFMNFNQNEMNKNYIKNLNPDNIDLKFYGQKKRI